VRTHRVVHDAQYGLDRWLLEYDLNVQHCLELHAPRVTSWRSNRNARVPTSAVSMTPAHIREGSIAVVSFGCAQSEQVHEHTGSAVPGHTTAELKRVPPEKSRKISRAVRAESIK
jgi:hypothetical protein